jgi:glycosyltransferase involved in cell wall biosynthesis
MRLSVVIPSYRDPLLHKTIESLLRNAVGELEVVVTLDGYWPVTQIAFDPRIKIVHHGETRGMREAINSAVRASSGEYIMRTDEHCEFCRGYDKALIDACEPNYIVTPRRYALDPVRWAVMGDVPPVDYMKLKIVNYDRGQKFSGVEWARPERAAIDPDETMAMQGSCWLMRRAWWDSVIGELQTEGYDTHYQDSHEMVFKTWKAGGKLMVVKSAWYAHKHRSFPRTHGYGGEKADKCFAYALSVWRQYYDEEIRPKWGI